MEAVSINWESAVKTTLQQDKNAGGSLAVGGSLAASGHFHSPWCSTNLRFYVLCTPESHRVMWKKISFVEMAMSCLSMLLSML